MGARRTLGRTVGESAVEVSSSRSGRVSSSSSILGPILACSVPRLSGTGVAIVAAKKYRPAPGADQTPLSARHTCGSFKLKSESTRFDSSTEKGARRLWFGTHSASARASHPLLRVPGSRESRRTSPGAPVGASHGGSVRLIKFIVSRSARGKNGLLLRYAPRGEGHEGEAQAQAQVFVDAPVHQYLGADEVDLGAGVAHVDDGATVQPSTRPSSPKADG